MTLSVVFITISVARDRQELLIFGLKETECPLSLFSFGFCLFIIILKNNFTNFYENGKIQRQVGV